jgi:resuscitation-promoting factor RpfC
MRSIRSSATTRTVPSPSPARLLDEPVALIKPLSDLADLARPTPPPPTPSDLPVTSVDAQAAVWKMLNQEQLDQQAAAYLTAQHQIELQREVAQAASERATYRPSTTAPGSQTSVSTGSSVAGGSIWSCIIQHESRGDPTAVNASSGAGGLYQFLPSTWHGIGMSGLPENYSAADQTAAAERLQAQQGWSPWIGDGCTPLG